MRRPAVVASLSHVTVRRPATGHVGTTAAAPATAPVDRPTGSGPAVPTETPGMGGA